MVPDRRSVLAGGAAGALLAMAGARARARAPVRNAVLVHGAYADGSCWSEVIPLLLDAGMRVRAVQNPLRSLEEDCEYARRVLALMDGPSVLVAHSYGGEIITQIGTDPKVAALVYCAARAPDAGEDYTALARTYPTPPATAGLVHAGGYAQLGLEAFLSDFANGVDPMRARVLHAVQGRTADTLFAARVTQAAWRSKPSHYAVSRQDRTIDPGLEWFMARRIGAATIEIDAGHLAIVSHPRENADLILRAAGLRA